MSNLAIKVENISKAYTIWKDPAARLKHPFLDLAGELFPALRPRIDQKMHGLCTEFYALKDVSFEVKRGESVGIIGRNGSGKSTLLQIIAGTLQPTEGSVTVNGRVAALLELGSGFNPEFTGRENVYLNCSILGLTKEETDARFDSIAEFADIGDFLDQPVKTYSSGMAMRLAFAVIAHIEADILIVDEALAVGDFIFTQKCYNCIQQLQEKGCTIILVSHDLSTISQYCKNAILLVNGKTEFIGSPNETINQFKKTQNILGVDSEKKNDLGKKEINSLNTNFSVSKNLKEYGSKFATIYDWGIIDSQDKTTSTLQSEESCRIVIRVIFDKRCYDPIVGYFISNKKGMEIVGTNTKYNLRDLGPQEAGNEVEIIFEQCLNLASGEYSLNLGCSEYINGELIAHHRMYDLCIINIIRERPLVGFYNPQTNLYITKVR